MKENTNVEKEILKTLEKNLWTYGSPVIFETCVICESSEEAAVDFSLTFANIFEKTIEKMTIKIHIIDSEGQENKAEHNYTDLKLGYL